MANLLDFSKERSKRNLEALTTYTRIIDTALSYILKKPGISYTEIVGFMMQRLGYFISLAPYEQRDKLIKAAISTLEKHSKQK